ncbi:endoglucanase [Pseudomonas duriflava]|uniref:Endoglucanase n=1 Tax=Pseudomonas duriflava TaxID=459528 RepID=A0A562QCD1_9PSED|nr:glycoside hydrolase family 5 protein [Pseudomonas duriflava]TWI54369.1 endoglucanase [Pseudomonas duriflava]
MTQARLFPRRLKQYAFLALTSLFLAPHAQAETFPSHLIGLNFSGAGFAAQVLPGVHGTNYFFPDDSYFRRWGYRGVRVVRLPITWERLQPQLNGELDQQYAELITKALDSAKRYKMRVVLDIHNYGRYRDQIVGSDAVPYSAYQNALQRVAKAWNQHPALLAYDIMNEPHDVGDHWASAAQHGIDGIRSVDKSRPILIEGNSWSSSARWPQVNKELLDLKDPADNLIFSAHLYFDEDGGGRYESKDTSKLDPMIGVKRAEPFIEWLKANNKKGHIGEFGVPDDDPRWLEAMDNLLKYLKQHCVPATYWAAGPGWGNYPLAIEPINNKERPQWRILKKYVKDESCSAIGPK